MTSNNVLVLGPPNSGKIRTCQFLTNDLETSTIPSDSHSGLVYNFDLKTKYYHSNVNLLIEEYPDTRELTTSKLSESLKTFLEEFSAEEYLELREALDGLIFTVGPEAASETELHDTITEMCKIKNLFEDSDIFCIAVGLYNQTTDLEAVEDAFISSGIEFVNFHESGKNEFNDSLGRDRLYEVLASHDWSHQAPAIPDAEYKKNKIESVQQMTKSLMEDDTSTSESQTRKNMESEVKTESGPESAMDLTEIFANFKIAKEKSQGMSLERKKAYVEELVEEYMNYF